MVVWYQQHKIHNSIIISTPKEFAVCV